MLCATVVLSTSAGAQEASTTVTAPDPKRVRLEKKIVKQTARVASCQARLDAGHAEVEVVLQQAVRMAATIRDSHDSGSKAVQTKDDVMRYLGKIIRFYQGEMKQIQENQRREATREAKDMWEEQIVKGNALIEKRVEDVLRITKSMESYADRAYNDDDDLSRTAARRADKVTDQVSAALAKDITKMETENAQFRHELTRTKSRGQRKRLGRRIDTNEFLIKRRREQIVETKVGKAGAQRAVSRSSARDIDRQIRGMFGDLKDIYRGLLKQKRQADSEKRKLALLQDRLEKLGEK
jgi:hypothetical protein